jgi:hypothetical protein
MRKKQFGILLTVSLAKETYKLVKEISEVYQISMGEVVRGSIDYATHYDGCWVASKPKPFTTSIEGGEKDSSGCVEVKENE